MKNLCFYVVYFLVFNPQSYFSQHLNRFNKHGERTGKWIVYLDSAKTIKSMEGRFRHDEVVGKSYYYTIQGVLERKEINRFKKLKTTLYYPDGSVRLKGFAKLESTAEKAHYYFYGRWKYYDEKGKLLKYCYYEKGKLLKTEYIDKNNKTNDTLINKLNAFEKRFTEKNQDLINKINASASNHDLPGGEKLRAKLMEQDSELFLEIGNFLQQAGYPSVKVAGESSIIPFFIISYATADIRANYLELFQRAVSTGDLNAKTFAYYVDKVKIAKGEKQIYGTQSYFDAKTISTIYFPVVDPENLDKRRAEMGLD